MYPTYESVMQTAGATVHAFANFGDYQGTWWAKVTYEGKTGWVKGYYGSCSGCDALQSQFDYSGDFCQDHYYDRKDGCAACAEAKSEHDAKCAEFGRGLLDHILTQEEAEKEASENLSWDLDASDGLKFLKENAS
jgi:hypothetical protein